MSASALVCHATEVPASESEGETQGLSPLSLRRAVPVPAPPLQTRRALTLDAAAVWNPLATRLSLRLAAWQTLRGSPALLRDQVLLWLLHGFPVPFSSIPPPFHLSSRPVLDPQHRQWLEQTELPRLQRLGVISEVPAASLQHSSPAFVVTKKHSSKLRLVIDHRHLNRFVSIPHVRFEGLRQARQLLRSNDWFFKIDLSDAYHHLGILPAHSTLLAFNILGRSFAVHSLCFGMSASPSAFHRLMLLVVNHLRVVHHLRVCWLLDDLLFLCDSHEHALQASNTVTLLLSSLGLCINKDKSQLTPTQTIDFLGLTISTSSSNTQPTFSATPDALSDIRLFASNVSRLALRHQQHRCPVRTLAALAGKVMSVSLAFQHARLLTREFYNLIKNGTNNARNPARRWSAWVSLSPQAFEDLQVLAHLSAPSLTRPVFLPSMMTAIRLFTDSSSQGWGATTALPPPPHAPPHALPEPVTLSGPWLHHFSRRHHITTKEVVAAALTLQALAPRLANARVLLLVDNSAACSIINSGTTRSNDIMPYVRQIYRVLAQFNITLHSRWISTSLNPADAPSRRFDKHAWSLSLPAFRLLCHRFGVPAVDLFAAADNTLLPTFCSFHPSPTALATDAFTLNWSRFPLSIAVPPFSVIQRTLQHIQESRSLTLLVVPYWPTRPWMADLLRLSLPHNRILLPPGSCRPQPLADRHLLPEIWTHWGIRLLAALIDCRAVPSPSLPPPPPLPPPLPPPRRRF